MLVALREKYALKGLEIVGIAVDSAVKVRDFAVSFQISYPVLLGEAGGLDLMRGLGNNAGGLPYTVVADRSGELVYRQLGILKQEILETLLAPLVGA